MRWDKEQRSRGAKISEAMSNEWKVAKDKWQMAKGRRKKVLSYKFVRIINPKSEMIFPMNYEP